MVKQSGSDISIALLVLVVFLGVGVTTGMLGVLIAFIHASLKVIRANKALPEPQPTDANGELQFF